jgi:hypothetical protein
MILTPAVTAALTAASEELNAATVAKYRHGDPARLKMGAASAEESDGVRISPPEAK